MDDFSNLNYNLTLDILKYISSNLDSYEDFIERLYNIKEKLLTATKSNSNVSISTIHSSKGLEYDNVFIIDLC